MTQSRLMIFAGTTEGRELAEYLEQRNVPADICVATEYGQELITAGTGIHRVRAGRLTKDEMADLMRSLPITHVVDATHPYAVEVTENIEAACRETGRAYLRLLRKEIKIPPEGKQAEAGKLPEEGKQAEAGKLPEEGKMPEEENRPEEGSPEDDPRRAGEKEEAADTGESSNSAPGLLVMSSIQEAVDYLKVHKGNVLAATGSRELDLYTQIPDYRSRVFARILSVPGSMDIAAALGFQGRNLICMQGPFSEELNAAMLRSVQAAYMVTKESGQAGGFPEKLRAARQAGATLIVVGRPPQKEGYAFDELIGKLEEAGIFTCGGGTSSGRKAASGEAERIRQTDSNDPEKGKRSVCLIGIGMGNPEGMTLEAHRAIREADLLIGASRMVESVADREGRQVFISYQPDEITACIREREKSRRIAILLSGDVGFYSGAKKLLDRLDSLDNVQVRVISGISSVAYLCGKLHTSWEDARLVSLHGRRQNLISAVARHPKVFALVGREETYQEICRDLREFGLGHVTVHVGSRLSYADEQILTVSAEEAGGLSPGDLCAVLIINERAGHIVTHGLSDEAFIRGKVPMTKSGVRSISLSRLCLKADSIIFDIGAGTGSVSIEAARMADGGLVYAIEKNAEAAQLIRQNMRHLQVSNVQVVEGTAPEALQDLPAPTHAFLGGTSGKLEEILRLLLDKNPAVRLVINAIALETLGEVTRVLSRLPVEEPEISCVNISRSKRVGNYHMMMAQNPVYVISCSGCPEKEEQQT